MPTMILPVLIVLVPVLEITAFIYVGQWIGLSPTIGLVLLTSIAGAMLLRIQGFGALRRIQKDLQKGVMPGKELADGFLVLIAGILLILPGFITDAIGLLLMVPPVRRLVWMLFRRHIRIVTFSASDFREEARYDDDPDDVVDLSPEDYARRPDGHSRRLGDGKG
jgi:UPF0716 protein FxsA